MPSDEEDTDVYEEDDEFVQALLNAMTYPLTPEDIQRASEGFTCGYIPRDRLHLYHDPDWY